MVSATAPTDVVGEAYDVIVVGGGPAGTTTASLVAEKGYDVLLLEREAESQFQIGESLVPATYWTLQRLGMVEKLKASASPKKFSVQFFGRSGKASKPFYFFENDPHESSMTWQVLRSDFDRMMLDTAREKGARVVEGAMVLEVLLEGDRATGVRVRLPDRSERVVAAAVIVDASGQSALMARRLKMKKEVPKLRKGSIYSHYEGAVRDEGIDAGATLIMSTENKDSWFWYIPLLGDRVSVGVVGSMDYLLQGRAGGPAEIFQEELALCRPMRERLSQARQLFRPRTTKDFSYRSQRLSGEGWVLVGDAFGFLDPIYSSGIFLALKSGEMAADAICEGLGKDDVSAAQLGKFGDEYLHGAEAFLKLIYAFYSKDFSFATFLKKHPECTQGIIDILSGNIFNEGVHEIFGPLEEML